MTQIGFSTGSLFKLGKSLDESIEIYSYFGINAIELSFASSFSLMDFKINDSYIRHIKQCGRVSVHAPWKNIRYSKNDTTYYILRKLRELSDNLDVAGFVLHPNVVDDFSVLEKSSLPFIVENMDLRKDSGIKIEEFRKLKEDWNFGFVLDVQHAYKHDPSMNLAEEYLEVMGDKLIQLHVSGQDDNRSHSLVHKSKNAREIAGFLGKNLNVPIILEGGLSKAYNREIPAELSFCKHFIN